MIKFHGIVKGFRRSYRLYQFIGNDGMKSAKRFVSLFGGHIYREESNSRKRDLFVEIETNHLLK